MGVGRAPASTGSLSGFIAGGWGVTTLLGPGGCPGVATAGCDGGVRGRPRETQIWGRGASEGPRHPPYPGEEAKDPPARSLNGQLPCDQSSPPHPSPSSLPSHHVFHHPLFRTLYETVIDSGPYLLRGWAAETEKKPDPKASSFVGLQLKKELGSCCYSFQTWNTQSQGLRSASCRHTDGQ